MWITTVATLWEQHVIFFVAEDTSAANRGGIHGKHKSLLGQKKKKKEEKIVSPWSRCLVFLLFIINMNITYTCICVYICIYKCKHIWTYIIHTNTYIYNLLYIYKLLNHIYYRKCVSFGVGNNQIILVTQTKAEKEHAAIKMRVVSAKKIVFVFHRDWMYKH